MRRTSEEFHFFTLLESYIFKTGFGLSSSWQLCSAVILKSTIFSVQLQPVNTNCGPGLVNTNLVPEPVNTNWGPGPVNTNLGPEPVNTNLGSGPGAGKYKYPHFAEVIECLLMFLLDVLLDLTDKLNVIC